MPSLWSNLTRLFHRKSIDPSLPPAALAWFAGSDSPTTAPTLTNAYQQVPWVYRAINALAEQVANVPFLFSVGDRGRENLITSGPLPDFYAHPHPHINRFQYWELRVIWLMLRGECIRVPIFDDGSTLSFKNPNSKIKHVLILDPARFQHIIQNNQLVGWRYTAFAHDAPLDSQIFLPEEVWFEKLPNPFDFWRGMPPLLVAALPTKTDFTSAAFMHGLIENNADLGLIVRTNDQLDPSQREQLIAELRNRKRRAGTPDKPTLIWSGAEIVSPTLSTADLQLLEHRKFTRAEICAAFGVPEEIVTTTDHSKYDVMAGARLNFIENRVAPFCRRLEAEENRTTIPALVASGQASHPAYQNQNSKIQNPISRSISDSALENRNSKIGNSVIGWFDLEALPIMQQALRTRLASAKIGFDMGIPFNHLNRLFDLGLPKLPWGDTGFLPSKYQPLGPTTPPSP